MDGTSTSSRCLLAVAAPLVLGVASWLYHLRLRRCVSPIASRKAFWPNGCRRELLRSSNETDIVGFGTQLYGTFDFFIEVPWALPVLHMFGVATFLRLCRCVLLFVSTGHRCGVASHHNNVCCSWRYLVASPFGMLWNTFQLRARHLLRSRSLPSAEFR